jgi:adenylate cyclase
MNQCQRHQVAERAGVELDFVSRLVELGILSPDDRDRFTPADVRRVTIVQTLQRAGVPLEGIGRAVRSGRLSLAFVDTTTYDRLASLSDVSFAELSEQTGVPTELLMVIREAVGSAQPRPSDRVRDDELGIVPLIQLQLASGVRPLVIERMLRVYGDSLRRIAETEADWWHAEVMPRLGAGMGPAEMMQAANQLSPRLARLGDQAVLAIYHAQQAHTWTTSIIEGIESALEAAGLHSRLERLPAVCFLDLSGYTRLTDERGDQAAAELAYRLARTVQRISVRHGGQPVKWLGDGVMFHFPEPAPGVLAALEMVQEAADLGLPPAHVGLHAGPVLFQDGDYFGRTVNLAARIAQYAGPGQVLVSQTVVDASRGLGVRFTDIGPVELKGVSQATPLSAAHSPAP